MRACTHARSTDMTHTQGERWWGRPIPRLVSSRRVASPRCEIANSRTMRRVPDGCVERDDAFPPACVVAADRFIDPSDGKQRADGDKSTRTGRRGGRERESAYVLTYAIGAGIRHRRARKTEVLKTASGNRKEPRRRTDERRKRIFFPDRDAIFYNVLWVVKDK